MGRSIKGQTKNLILHNPEFAGLSQAFRAFFHVLVSNALYRNIPFLLTVADVQHLTGLSCHYCGLPPQKRVFGSMKYTGYFTGIDRKDASEGYTLANCLPACKTCNRIKSVSSYEEYLAHARRIVALHP